MSPRTTALVVSQLVGFTAAAAGVVLIAKGYTALGIVLTCGVLVGDGGLLALAYGAGAEGRVSDEGPAGSQDEAWFLDRAAERRSQRRQHEQDVDRRLRGGKA